MRRDQLYRDALRRADAGLEQLIVNGTTVDGPVVEILSPMASVPSTNVIRIDNANVKTLVDGAVIGGIDASLNTHFKVTIAGNRTMEIPSNPRDGEKITFLIRQANPAGWTLVWTAGAGGYRFANAASPQGVKLADVTALLAAVPVGAAMRVGFEYDGADLQWDCVALAGYWT